MFPARSGRAASNHPIIAPPSIALPLQLQLTRDCHEAMVCFGRLACSEQGISRCHRRHPKPAIFDPKTSAMDAEHPCFRANERVPGDTVARSPQLLYYKIRPAPLGFLQTNNISLEPVGRVSDAVQSHSASCEHTVMKGAHRFTIHINCESHIAPISTGVRFPSCRARAPPERDVVQWNPPLPPPTTLSRSRSPPQKLNPHNPGIPHSTNHTSTFINTITLR